MSRAIYPVIGIILILAVTVALVGLVTFTVLNLSDETGNSDVPDSSIKT